MKTKFKNENIEYEFIGKTLFFKNEKILVVGDLHLGYELMLKESGTNMPLSQINQTLEELEDVIKKLEQRKIKLNKLIFLGDIKHYFSYKKQERNIFIELLNLIEKHINKEDIVFIRGNHEKLESLERTFVFYYVYQDIAFIHGDKIFPEIFTKKIKRVVMGHLHPAINISDYQNIRSEKYKCFLIGNYKSKQFFILPSFFPLIEGTSINEYISENACIIPPNNLKNFEVFALGNSSIFNFGKLRDLIKK
ncbi:MAG TPA: metallophosphoesterase [Candidatus Paceibacterota bacterium]|nr:metallophosphoesterase [Candidatus Paceibacterota bacterium]